MGRGQGANRPSWRDSGGSPFVPYDYFPIESTGEKTRSVGCRWHGPLVSTDREGALKALVDDSGVFCGVAVASVAETEDVFGLGIPSCQLPRSRTAYPESKSFPCHQVFVHNLPKGSTHSIRPLDFVARPPKQHRRLSSGAV